MKREYYLDNLKVFLTLLVIFHHAGQAYGNGGGWAYTPSNSAEFLPWIWHFFSVNAGFFMGLFFLISGYFVPKSYDMQGGKTFVKKKLVRLGIPLLFMGAITSAITGTLEPAHMWFVESLLVFCLLYALIRCFCKPAPEDCSSTPTLPGILILGLIMGVGSYFIRKVSPQDNWIMVPLKIEPAHYLQYVMMFAIGVLSGRFNWFEKMTGKVGATSLILGALLAGGMYSLGENPWSGFIWDWYGIYESLMCVFMCFGLIWLFRECFSRTSGFMQWCAAQSYGAYVFHLLIMLGIQYATDGIWMGAFGKFIFIGISTTIVSYALTWLVRLIPGANKVL
ncbi:MAG: acyltransferase family protein [Bacteroidia bacterium]|nr:acyltransferase family protein [Bacteroidia bacterium]